MAPAVMSLDPGTGTTLWTTVLGQSQTGHGGVRQCGPSRCRGLFRGVAPPALLCHKEPAPRIHSPILGALERTKGGFGCEKLVLYGIRVLAEQLLEEVLDIEMDHTD